jgi:hypothetical protein
MPTLMSEAGAASLLPAVLLLGVLVSLPLLLSLPHAVAPPKARMPTVRMDAKFLLRRKTPPMLMGHRPLIG